MSAARMGGRRGKPEEPDEHINHDRWLVTYADMLTLLMVLFIILFAMSHVDEKKYDALKNGLARGFGGESAILKGSDSVLDGQDAATDVLETLTPQQQAMVTQALDQERAKTRQMSYDEATKEVDRLKEAQRKLMAALTKRGLADDVSTTIDDRGLVVSLVSRHVVFRPNIAQLSPRGQLVVDTLAPVLRSLGNDLRIDGHTNQAAGRPKYFATDWDLSSARAVEVLRRLNEVAHIAGARLSLSAFGHEVPLVDPATPGSQEVNKRVDIVVLPKVGSTSQDLLDEVANAGPGDSSGQDRADGSDDEGAGENDTAASADHASTEQGGHS